MSLENSMMKTRPNRPGIASLENEQVRLDYFTNTGPRIVGLYVRGSDKNLLAETPDVHWETPHGEYYLHGGHRLWTAPEDPFYTCPENDLEVVEENGQVVLSSPKDVSGLQKEITIQLETNCVHLSHRVTWHGGRSMTLAPWAITQLQLGGMAILPFTKVAGLLPDRNLVLWPYASIKDERFELHDELILLHGRSSAQAFKIGNFNSQGWIACALGNTLFIKHFTADIEESYPDRGCNVEAYVKDSCIELETLGPLKTLKPGDSTCFEETWEVLTGNYPSTLEGARNIKKQLSKKS